MPDYVRQENPWQVASRSAGAFSDPIFEMFAKLPQARAELAMSAQKLGLQQREQARMERLSEAQIPNIKSETELHLANAAKMALQSGQIQSNMDTQGRLGRLQGYATSPMFGQMLKDPQQGLQVRQDLSNVLPQGEFNTSMPELLKAVQAALSSGRESLVASSPSAVASTMTPYNTPSGTIDRYGNALTGPPPFSLGDGAQRYSGDNKLIAENPKSVVPHATDPSTQAVHYGNFLKQLDDLGLDFNKQVQGGVTNRVPTPQYSWATNALANINNPTPQTMQPSSASSTQPGQTYKGFKFKGGDWKDQNNWEKQ